MIEKERKKERKRQISYATINELHFSFNKKYIGNRKSKKKSKIISFNVPKYNKLLYQMMIRIEIPTDQIDSMDTSNQFTIYLFHSKRIECHIQ